MMRFILLVFCLFFVTRQSLSAPNVINMKIKDIGSEDPGVAENCGDVPFEITWSPKVLRPSGKVTVSVNYTLPYDLKSGFLDAKVFFVGDTEPFVGYSNPFSCKDIEQYMPICPIGKGTHIQHPLTIPNLRVLSSYPGDYVAEIKVSNQDKLQMFCAKLTVTVDN